MSSIKERKAHFQLDQSSAPNQLNYTTNWMSYKGMSVYGRCFGHKTHSLLVYVGAWITVILIAIVIKISYSLIPFISPEISWTLTNLTFNAVKYHHHTSN
jgi:sensor histidine kinase YesM